MQFNSELPYLKSTQAVSTGLYRLSLRGFCCCPLLSFMWTKYVRLKGAKFRLNKTVSKVPTLFARQINLFNEVLAGTEIPRRWGVDYT